MRKNESCSLPGSGPWSENPKSVFRRLPRPAHRDVPKRESPKGFLRYMAELRRQGLLGPIVS
jgi:hypothetical protein